MKAFGLVLLAFGFLFACTKTNTADEPVKPPVKPEIVLSEVSSSDCLNLEKVMAKLSDPNFQYPTSIMTNQFRPISDMSPSKSQFLSYANFYYKTGIPSDLSLINVASQKDCSSIQLQTASHEILNFTITEHTATNLRFELTDSFKEDMPTYKQKSLFERTQPYGFDVTYLSEHSLKITEKFRTFDPLCLTKNDLRLEITKIVNWGKDPSQLPQSYDFETFYLNIVKGALTASPIPPEDPTLSVTSSVSIDQIKGLMASPIRDELKLCL